MNITVFGNRGFIGSRVIENRSGKHQVVPGVILEKEDVWTEAIINCAGAIVRKNPLENTSAFIDGNINYLNRILGYARKCKNLKKLIHLSTNEVYGDAAVPKEETATERPENPYSATKAGGDFLALSYHTTFGVPVVILRPCNVYGPRMVGWSFIPTLIKTVRNKGMVQLYGDGSFRKQWLWIDDLVDAIEFAVENLEPGQKYNCPGPEAIPNRDVFYVVQRLLKTSCALEYISDYGTIRGRGKDYESLMDGTKLANAGFRPRTFLIEGIQKML